jgi:hypothetical protein
MRSYLLLAIIFGSLPICFLKPYIGVLVWSWVGYMNPHRLTWGIAYHFPIAQLVAIPTLLGFFLFAEDKKFLLKRETILFILLCFLIAINTFFFALHP